MFHFYHAFCPLSVKQICLILNVRTCFIFAMLSVLMESKTSLALKTDGECLDTCGLDDSCMMLFYQNVVY